MGEKRRALELLNDIAVAGALSASNSSNAGIPAKPGALVERKIRYGKQQPTAEDAT